MNNILLLCQGYQNLAIAYDLLDQGYNLDIIVPTGLPEYELMLEPLSKLDNVYVVDTRDKFLELLPRLLEKTQYRYIFPTFPDHHMRLIAEINDRYDLPGIRVISYEKLKEKIIYQEIWESLDIDVPRIYKIVENKKTLETVPVDVKFPCLVKPSGGMSGLGIKIISTEEKLKEFFEDVDVKVHEYQESHGTKYKNFEYYSDDTDYIIQEYVDGLVISVIGHVISGSMSIDVIYDIESDSYPYAAETALIYPSKHATKEFYQDIKYKLEKFISFVKLNDCPFMLDIILKDGKSYFIDFAARTSAGNHLLKYAGECHYASKLVNSILERKSLSLELEKASMKKGLGLRSGVIKNIEIKKQNLADYIKLPTNNKVNLPRNDISISNNGYVYMSGNSLDDMHKKYGELVESIRVTYL